jgi:hypothetical protein
MKNGISADDKFLYLACTRIHSGDNTLVPESWCRISKLDQNTTLSFFRMIVAELICQVESYVVRASLDGEASFDDVVATKEATFFANGAFLPTIFTALGCFK